VELDLALSPPATFRSPQGWSYDSAITRASVAACARLAWSAGCALLSGGVAWSEGIDPSAPARDQALWFAAGLRVRFEPRLVGGLRLLVYVDGLAVLRGLEAVFIEGASGGPVVAWSSPALAVVGAAGLGWDFL
jgi:hypothetical protein